MTDSSSKPLNILYVTYPAAFQNVGGGEIVVLKLREYVERAGHRVKFFDMWSDRVEQYDVVHVFGSVKDCLGLMRVANARKVPIVITPVFWSSWKHALKSYGSVWNKANLTVRHAVKLAFPAFPSGRRSMMLASDRIIPNSVMEQDQISRLFRIPKERMNVVYNGVDRRFEAADPSLWRARHGSGDFILTVGRLEPRKNQLNLIRAVRRMTGMKLVVIGSPVSGFESYAEACRSEGEGFTHFVGGFAHEDPMLASAYAAARVYALPAWFETPGLVALEAALAGSCVAATEGGSTREYFGGRVEYFDLSRPADIASALAKTLARSDQGVLKKHILDHFTWDKVAADTVTVYRRAAGKEQSS